MTAQLEEAEKRVTTDYMRQLDAANKHIDKLHEKLCEKSAECFRQKADVTRLLKDIVERQTAERKVCNLIKLLRYNCVAVDRRQR
jgi:chemotaxis methyl-accepting protein methylase